MQHVLILTANKPLFEAFSSHLTMAGTRQVTQVRELQPLLGVTEEPWNTLILDAQLVNTAIDPHVAMAHLFGSMKHVAIFVINAKEERHTSWLRSGVTRTFSMVDVERVPTVCEEMMIWMGRFRAWTQGGADATQFRKELLMLNAMVQGLAGTLDREMLISRSLRNLASACKQGAVAYLALEKKEVEPPKHQGLFTESEAQDLEETPTPTASTTLKVVHQLAFDRLLVCINPRMHSSWDELMLRRAPLILREQPDAGQYPGLEPLWHRMSQGLLYLIPIYGRDVPIGVLVLAEMSAEEAIRAPFESESLWSIASLFGGAMETARMFDELHHAYGSLQTAQEQFVQSEKFAAVGLLAAQIAHEINNPSSFVISNMSVMQQYMASVATFVQEVHRLVPETSASKLQALEEEYEIEFLNQDIQDLLTRSLNGMQRIHQIIHDLRYLAHDSGPEHAWVDLEALLDAAVNIIRSEVRYYATVKTTYAKGTQVFSDGNKLSQVFLNILVNASQALQHKESSDDDDFIQVTTQMHQAGHILVSIEDSGLGIDQEHLPAIFEPFFTTKPRGEGTGLGLSLSRDILQSLGGDIRVFSELGKGTRFEILIPIHSPNMGGRHDRSSGSFESLG